MGKDLVLKIKGQNDCFEEMSHGKENQILRSVLKLKKMTVSSGLVKTKQTKNNLFTPEVSLSSLPSLSFSTLF